MLFLMIKPRSAPPVQIVRDSRVDTAQHVVVYCSMKQVLDAMRHYRTHLQQLVLLLYSPTQEVLRVYGCIRSQAQYLSCYKKWLCRDLLVRGDVSARVSMVHNKHVVRVS